MKIVKDETPEFKLESQRILAEMGIVKPYPIAGRYGAMLMLLNNILDNSLLDPSLPALTVLSHFLEDSGTSTDEIKIIGKLKKYIKPLA